MSSLRDFEPVNSTGEQIFSKSGPAIEDHAARRRSIAGLLRMDALPEDDSEGHNAALDTMLSGDQCSSTPLLGVAE